MNPFSGGENKKIKYQNDENIIFKAYGRVCIIAFIGTIISIIAFLLVLNQNMAALENEFRHNVNTEILSLKHKTQTLEQFWTDVQSFYAASQKVEEHEFSIFSRASLRQKDLAFIAWVPDAPGRKAEDLYLVAKPWVDAAAVKEFLVTDPAIAEIIEVARELRYTAISKPFRLPFIGETDERRWLASAIPTYYLEGGSAEVLRGFVITFREVTPFFAENFLSSKEKRNNIYIYLTDEQKNFRSLVFHDVYQNGPFADIAMKEFAGSRSAFSVKRTIPFGPLQLEVHVNPSFSYLAQGANWGPWTALVLCLVVTAFTALWFYQQINQNIEIKKVVEEKTATLASRERHMRAILTNTVDGIITIDNTGIIQTFNPACTRIFGYQSDEVLGQHISMLMPDLEDTGGGTGMETYMRSDAGKLAGDVRAEAGGRRKDGTRFPLELTIGEVKEDYRHSYVGVFRDITERKQYERELKESHQAMDDFVYIVSHDLKEPLRGIYSYAQFLQEDYVDKIDEDGQKKLETLKTLAKRMEELIDTLLYYSRLGRTELAFQKTDLQEVMAKTLDLIKPLVRAEDVTIDVADDLPVILCDTARVSEIFRNLIVNAIKYNDSPHKHVKVGVTTSHSDYPGHRVFFVADNGIGIPEKYREIVFRMFKRLHGRDLYGGGTGSGLTIVKKLVDRHGGKIWIEDNLEEGQGSVFYFTLEP